MHSKPDAPISSPSIPSAGTALDERLEGGELILFETCPFALPEGDDLQFLLSQTVEGAKSISYFPEDGRITGHRFSQSEDHARLNRLLREFHQSATDWLGRTLPRYRNAARFGPLRFRTEEEAEREDVDPRYSGSVLHVDMNGDAPADGESFLRIFVNINPTQSREWITSDSLPALLDHWGEKAREPGEKAPGWWYRLKSQIRRALKLPAPADSPYHQLMSRLHFFGKTDEYLQQQAPRKHWVFPPRSAWLVFSDIVSHAVVRGQYAIDQTYLIPADGFRQRARSTRSTIERFWQRKQAVLPE